MCGATAWSTQRGQLAIHNRTSRKRDARGNEQQDDLKCLHIQGWGLRECVCVCWKCDGETVSADWKVIHIHSIVAMFTVNLKVP